MNFQKQKLGAKITLWLTPPSAMLFKNSKVCSSKRDMTKKFKETNEDENRRIVIEASNESQACFKICQTVVP